MTNLNNSTDVCMSELSYNICDETSEYKVQEDCETRIFENIVNTAYQTRIPVRVVKENPICPVCNKPLTRNGTKTTYLNKNVEVKCQKYIHKDCENSSCIASLHNIKDKFCTYMRSIRDKGVIRSLMGYNSYQNKKESISDQYEVDIPRNTIYYHEQEISEDMIKELETEQYKIIKERNIRPSGIYSYDEQYVFIKKQLYMRMTLIDQKNKLIMYEHLVSKEDFNDTTIRKLLKNSNKHTTTQSNNNRWKKKLQINNRSNRSNTPQMLLPPNAQPHDTTQQTQQQTKQKKQNINQQNKRKRRKNKTHRKKQKEIPWPNTKQRQKNQKTNTKNKKTKTRNKKT